MVGAVEPAAVAALGESVVGKFEFGVLVVADANLAFSLVIHCPFASGGLLGSPLYMVYLGGILAKWQKWKKMRAGGVCGACCAVAGRDGAAAQRGRGVVRVRGAAGGRQKVPGGRNCRGQKLPTGKNYLGRNCLGKICLVTGVHWRTGKICLVGRLPMRARQNMPSMGEGAKTAEQARLAKSTKHANQKLARNLLRWVAGTHPNARSCLARALLC